VIWVVTNFSKKKLPKKHTKASFKIAQVSKTSQCAYRATKSFFSFDDHMKKLKSTSLESAKSTKKSYAPLTPGKGYSASSTGWRDLTIEGHKYALRQNTAYSGLRNYLSITAWLTAIGFAILGLVLLSENNKGIGVSLLIAGPLLAALQYFIASVYFDIADAGLNTSMRIQDLHRMESSKDPKTERS